MLSSHTLELYFTQFMRKITTKGGNLKFKSYIKTWFILFQHQKCEIKNTCILRLKHKGLYTYIIFLCWVSIIIWIIMLIQRWRSTRASLRLTERNCYPVDGLSQPTYLTDLEVFLILCDIFIEYQRKYEGMDTTDCEHQRVWALYALMLSHVH